VIIEPGFLTVVLTAYPFSSSILMSAEAMYPLPPVTHAIFFFSTTDDDIAAGQSATKHLVYAAGDWRKPGNLFTKVARERLKR
jgi:hypothetical protein